VTKHSDIQQDLIETAQLPNGAAGLVVSLDRGALPMEEPVAGAPARRRRGKSRTKRRTSKEKQRRIEPNFRIAYCGTLSIVDKQGEALHTIRYGRMPHGDAVALAEGLASDVFAHRARSRGPLHVTLVQDGAVEPWNLLDAQLNEETLGFAPCRLIDMFHLVEKLAEAAKALHDEFDAKAALRRWKVRLLNAKTGAKMNRELHGANSRATAVHEAITYIENNADRMNYATARSEGRPLGSGCVEATCKSLGALRMKRPGARWKEDTGEHIVQLRALSLSDRWEAALRLTLQRCSRFERQFAGRRDQHENPPRRWPCSQQERPAPWLGRTRSS